MNKNVSSCKRPCDLVKTRHERSRGAEFYYWPMGQTARQIREISDALGICLATIFNIRRHYHEEGLERAIGEGARSGQPPKFKGKAAKKITAIACSTPPDGQARWSLRLLADHVIELDIVKSISHQSISNILKKRT